DTLIGGPGTPEVLVANFNGVDCFTLADYVEALARSDNQKSFLRACEAAGIRAEAIDPQQARIIEPSVNPALIGAVKVPDGTVDP
ncbi:DUF1460 domain-containing protein, partial [Salmonella enterica subsp. enterica serovar Kentucky]|nr:DUF1460 domain-containing protein [Salmonella enterica subsp. enterica serovar Kentucky]